MTFVGLLFISIGLSMDAFAVSVSNGMCYPNMNKVMRFKSALCFGIFQALMPVIGFFIGSLFTNLVTAVDHWIALILLGLIGGNMIIEGIKDLRENPSCPASKEYTNKILLLQGIATSIDALAIGISFAALSVNIWSAASCIGIITFLCCLVGILLGKKFGTLLGHWAQILGGVILVIIGVNIFIEHMQGG